MARTRPKSGTLTELDHRILAELRANARLSFRTLAQRLGVSTPTVSKRVQRMERAGIIQGYTVLTPELPAPAAQLPTGLSCAHCKNPIEGPPRIRRFQDETRVFCCDVCAGAWMERRQKAVRSPGASMVVFVILGPVFSFGIVLLACSSTSCMSVTPFHREFAACVPWADRSRPEFLSGPGSVLAGRRRPVLRGPRQPVPGRRRRKRDLHPYRLPVRCTAATAVPVGSSGGATRR